MAHDGAVRASFVALVVLLSPGCSREESHAVEQPESEWPPLPSAFLSTDSYDCSASGAIEPPTRPHAHGCFADASCTSRLVVGHRMATPFAPENSLSALRAAILLGVDIVETDVRLTADGEVVLVHDGTVDRTLDGTGNVDQLTLAQLQALEMRAEGKDGDFSCDRVPTLAETFALSAGRIIVELEVKDSDAGVKSAEYLRDNGLYGDAFLLCSPAECQAVRAAVPDAPIMSRPEAAAEVAAEIMYSPPPIMVHIDAYEAFLAADVLALIHGVGAKAYANAFLVADVAALGEGRLEAYVEMYDSGLDVVQTELPHYALLGLGRLETP